MYTVGVHRFTVQTEGREPVECDSADQAVQWVLSALHHGQSGRWVVNWRRPWFPEHPTKRRGLDELYVSPCRGFALRKLVRHGRQRWTVLHCVEGDWQEVHYGESRAECEEKLDGRQGRQTS